MKSLLRFFLLLLVAANVVPGSVSAQRLQDKAVPGEILVKFRPVLSAKQRSAVLARHGAYTVRHFETLGLDHISLPAGKDVRETIVNLLASGEVLLAQPNYLRHKTAEAPPNDPYWQDNTLWGMIRIQAREAWTQFTTGDGSVVLADIDTGVNYNHPDLAANIWQNPGEIPGNNIDDDGNGYIDDVHGIDAVNHDSDPIDDEGHGTHTAGTMAAVGNNGVGTVGVSWNAKIIVCKFLAANGYGDDAGAIDCLEYLVALKQRGVNVRATNNSWSGSPGPGDPSPDVLQDAFDAAGAVGILNVCAAGNDGTNNDTQPTYPASFHSPSIITVGASDADDRRPSFNNNYGPTSVHLAAPGDGILSTVLSGYGGLSGTSMSAPHVAGAVALLAQLQPSASAETMKSLLLSNVDQVTPWAGLSVTGGRLNVFKAAQAAATGRKNFQVIALSQVSATSVAVTWASVPGMRYRVFAADEIASGSLPVSGVIIAGAAETAKSFTDLSANGGRKFYRVEIVP